MFISLFMTNDSFKCNCTMLIFVLFLVMSRPSAASVFFAHLNFLTYHAKLRYKCQDEWFWNSWNTSPGLRIAFLCLLLPANGAASFDVSQCCHRLNLKVGWEKMGKLALFISTLTFSVANTVFQIKLTVNFRFNHSSF
jgi:hypothetical protein